MSAHLGQTLNLAGPLDPVPASASAVTPAVDRPQPPTDERTRLTTSRNALSALESGMAVPVVRFYYRIPAYTTKVVKKWVEVEVVNSTVNSSPGAAASSGRATTTSATTASASSPQLTISTGTTRPTRERHPPPIPTPNPTLLSQRLSQHYYNERFQRLSGALPTMNFGPGLVHVIGYFCFCSATILALVMFSLPFQSPSPTPNNIGSQIRYLLQSPSFYLFVMFVVDVLSLSSIFRNRARVLSFEVAVKEIVETFNAFDSQRFAVVWTLRRSWSEDMEEVARREEYIRTSSQKRFNPVWFQTREYVVEAQLRFGTPTSPESESRGGVILSEGLPIYQPYVYEDILKDQPPAEFRLAPPTYTLPSPPPVRSRSYFSLNMEDIELQDRRVIPRRSTSTNATSIQLGRRSNLSVGVITATDPSLSHQSTAPMIARRSSDSSASSNDRLDPNSEGVDLAELSRAEEMPSASSTHSTTRV
ncbi:hypothetical protein BJ742DRAFT_795146 [Cladochytrium replicatum]|nr:hypothetical protein BJ742DRAFT_795146 [Cladochytrium replicatum]